MKLKLDPDSANFFYDFIHTSLEKNFEVLERNNIEWGCQLKLSEGIIVNLYYSVKYSLGGSHIGKVKYLLPELIKEFL